MGDGYVQTAEDGINSLQEEWSVVFTPMKLTDAQAFNTLLKSYIRTTVIDWQAPMESSLTKWKITAYSVREIAGKVYEFNVTFVRHYGV
jgi:phage-related protein